MEYIRYKESQKKQWMFAGLALVSTIFCAFAIERMSGSLLNIAILILFWLSTTGTFLYMLRCAAKVASCPKCNIDLYETIEGLKNNQKVQLRYCPGCGLEVSVEAT